uniref:3-phosphoinositide-dependent protein kinase 1 n=2 Tax=Arion vulgaris TaxID=1028688 RepID=A0A0B7AQB0_9EUPU
MIRWILVLLELNSVEILILKMQYLNTNVPKTDIPRVATQQIPNIYTLACQTLETLVPLSECANLAHEKTLQTELQDQHSFSQSKSLQKNVLDVELEESIEYIDSYSGNSDEIISHQIVLDTSLKKSKITPASVMETNRLLMSVDSNSNNAVQEAEGLDDSSEVVSNSTNISHPTNLESRNYYHCMPDVLTDMKPFIGPDKILSIMLSETESVSRNQRLKHGELANQVLKESCIVLPSSVTSSNSDQNLLNQPTTNSSSCMSILHHNTTVASLNNTQAATQYTHLCTDKMMHIENKASLTIVQHESPGNVDQSMIGKENFATDTAKPLPDSSSGQTSAQSKTKKTPNDFIFGKVIGEGSYSTVYLARDVSTQREFAIKVCDKKHLIRERKTHFVMREKEVLMKLDHPFFIKLAYTFQDQERLYYVLTYACNGELLRYLQKLSAFDVPCTRFYSAEIVLALEYLHGLGIIHRDLKPENILLSEDMHIKITDFGTSKILPLDSNEKAENVAEVKRKNSFVGTAEYVSPEVLNNQPANFGSDLWALGCIIYQCLSGSLPFRSGNEYKTFQKIVKIDYEFPEGFNPQAKDLVQKLLVFKPSERLGMIQPEGMNAVKSHPFYDGIDWKKLPETTAPTLMPYLPATANNPEFWGHEHRVGFSDQRFAEIITGQTEDGSLSPMLEEMPIRELIPSEDTERAAKLKKQKMENQFHQFVKDNVILRQGFVDKRKGLFARKRMLLLTEGPHLFYVDAHNKVLKGEIPWSKYMRPEVKNFKIFFVHTPNRTYYLESRQPDAQLWVKQIKDVWNKYYGSEKEKSHK